MQPRRWIGRLLLLVVGLAAAVGAGELVARSLSDQQLGFRFNGQRFLRPKEFDWDETRNRWGFHDVEHRVEREPGVQRLLLLGDSFVEAGAVAIPETVGQRLQHHLTRRGAQRWEVVSLGKSGWGQTQQLDILRQLGPQLRPDVVVTLFLHMNDISDNSAELKALTHREYQTMARFQPGWGKMWSRDAPVFWFKHSVLNQLLSHRLAQLSVMRSEQIPSAYLVYRTPVDPRFSAAWQTTAAAVRATRDLCQTLGARYLMASASTPHGVLGATPGLEYLIEAYPGMAEGQWDLTLPDRRMASTCAELGVPFHPLEPELGRRTAAGEVLHFPHDGHWNVAGNEAGAQLLAALVP